MTDEELSRLIEQLASRIRPVVRTHVEEGYAVHVTVELVLTGNESGEDRVMSTGASHFYLPKG